MSVVLPQPLGPIRPTRAPEGMVNETSRTTVLPPRLTCRCSIRIAGSTSTPPRPRSRCPSPDDLLGTSPGAPEASTLAMRWSWTDLVLRPDSRNQTRGCPDWAKGRSGPEGSEPAGDAVPEAHVRVCLCAFPRRDRSQRGAFAETDTVIVTEAVALISPGSIGMDGPICPDVCMASRRTGYWGPPGAP